MATETATLIFRADTDQLREAERRLRAVERQGRQTEQGAKGVAMNFRAMAGAAAAAAAVIGGLSKTIDVARQFDVISASLKTMTGSTEAAQRAFLQIQEFAKTTPYDLAQVAGAFNILNARGLNPSMDSLRAYGNTASAMGKDLNQMIEAVADAATGEFERLKEFGIVARSQGDQVALTFRGVTTTIGKNANEIENYLVGLGQVEFAGAMAERAATLDGALSNLGDSWDGLFLTISQSAVGGLIKQTAIDLGEMLDVIDRGIRKLNGQLTLDEQLADLYEQSARLASEQDAWTEKELDQKQAVIAAQIEALKAQKAENEEKAKGEQIAASNQRAEAAAAEQTRIAADAQAKLYESKRSSAEAALAAAAQANMTEAQLVEQRYTDDLTKFQELLAQKLISEEEFQTAMDELKETRERARNELAYQRLQEQLNAEWELFNNQADLEEAAHAERQAKKVEQEKTQADALMAIEDVFLKGKNEKQKAAFRLGTSLMDAKKREEAKGIITSSYAAAMDAYKSLAGIPIVGPALGAAAFAATIAMGAQAAGQALAGRALGGQVRAGESYVVGERGPEVLTMGGTGGRITTNQDLRNSQGNATTVQKVANVSFSIQANDTAGFDDLLASRRGQIVSLINQALNDSGREALV